jgi:hypothetical protein
VLDRRVESFRDKKPLLRGDCVTGSDLGVTGGEGSGGDGGGGSAFSFSFITCKSVELKFLANEVRLINNLSNNLMGNSTYDRNSLKFRDRFFLEIEGDRASLCFGVPDLFTNRENVEIHLAKTCLFAARKVIPSLMVEDRIQKQYFLSSIS